MEKYKTNLKNGIITEEMLEQVLNSLNQRAKKYRNKKDEYEEQKKFLLTTLLKPVCIYQKINFKSFTKGVYLTEEELSQYKDIQNITIVNSNFRIFDKKQNKELLLVNIMTRELYEEYYLCYKTKNYSYYFQIENPKDYPDLEIVKINYFAEFYKDIKQLASAHFCKKLIELVKSGNYQYVQSE